MKYKIREAKISDVKDIHRIINKCAEEKTMLPRSLNEIYEGIQGYWVSENNNKIVGCCALAIRWQDLAEIKSLAVEKPHQGNKIGTELVIACQKEAKDIGIKKIFVLTYIPKFFKKLGYREVHKKNLPHKIWTECINCPFFPNCNEVALIKNF